ncbi:translation machinery-associated protein 16 [Basidiobolus ranarum]|uniref:Translation machinery-associated protein 16 n=1 Tax=Basidiobolus ranarum TaxID=34480 RepID=A0ABR2VVW2_9FUNG
MPNNKRKTLKTVKGKDKAHPYSRKALQINRINLRQDKLDKRKSDWLHQANPTVERYLWFRWVLDEEQETATREQLVEFIEMYLCRNDEELAQLKALHRPGQPRPKAAREDLIMLLKKKETEEFNHGFILPDLTISKNVKFLRQWDSDINSMTNIRTIKIKNTQPDQIADSNVMQN